MPGTRDRIAELSTEGVSAIDIARRLNLAESTVSYHLERIRLGSPKPRVARVPDRNVVQTIRTRDRVAALLAEGLTRAEVARRLGLRKATVSYHARRLGLAVDERPARRYDWAVIQRYYDQGNSVRDCVRAFGFTHETWQAARKRGAIVTRPQRTPDDQLFASGRLRNRGNLKRRLLVDGLKPNGCASCGLGDWCRQPISLALHHINGDRLDNRVENLELLCPNCHSQTVNYSGRNGHRRRPATEAPPSRPPSFRA